MCAESSGFDAQFTVDPNGRSTRRGQGQAQREINVEWGTMTASSVAHVPGGKARTGANAPRRNDENGDQDR
jgi:hypothetical protein